MFEQIKSILQEYVDVPEEQITPELRFMNDLSMTSLDIMAMIGQIEDELDVVIETKDLTHIFTVQDLMDYLNTLK